MCALELSPHGGAQLRRQKWSSLPEQQRSSTQPAQLLCREWLRDSCRFLCAIPSPAIHVRVSLHLLLLHLLLLLLQPQMGQRQGVQIPEQGPRHLQAGAQRGVCVASTEDAVEQ